MATKKKYVKIVGITGEGQDYNIYKMTLKEMTVGFFIGFAGGLCGAQIMFGNIILNLVMGGVAGIVALPLYGKLLHSKQRKLILMQFRDLLDSLSNSFSSGKNTPDAFSDALNDMRLSFGEEAPITKEVAIILAGLHSNFSIEELLGDMSLRCGIDDIGSFSDTFTVSNRIGGNLKKIVSDSRDIINDKIEIEMEIQTTLAANKNEINILAVMPFAIVLAMGLLGEKSIGANSAINIIVKFIALGLFAIAYAMGKKITNIKV